MPEVVRCLPPQAGLLVKDEPSEMNYPPAVRNKPGMHGTSELCEANPVEVDLHNLAQKRVVDR